MKLNGKSGKTITWTLRAIQLKGLVGYGITAKVHHTDVRRFMIIMLFVVQNISKSFFRSKNTLIPCFDCSISKGHRATQQFIVLFAYQLTLPTVFPFPKDVEDRTKFDENTIMVRSNSGFINGGSKSCYSRDRHTVLRWKNGDTIICSFDCKKGSFSMKKVT